MLFGDRNGQQRIGIGMKPDGTPSIMMTDDKAKPRLEMAVDSEGKPKVETLDSEGKAAAHGVSPK